MEWGERERERGCGEGKKIIGKLTAGKDESKGGMRKREKSQRGEGSSKIC